MKENINYSSPEGEEFQAKPHVSLIKSKDFPGKWRVDLRWREDNYSESIDGVFNFVDGYAPLTAALKEAFFYAGLLNIPIARYKDNSMIVLKKPIKPSTAHQNGQLEFLKNSEGAQRFSTH
jgi:hypothetical protein